ARVAGRRAGPRPDDVARPAVVATSPGPTTAARQRKRPAEAADAAPDAETKHDAVLVRFLVKSSNDGKPIAGAKIVARPDGVDPVELTTDSDGRARMPSAIPWQERL